MYAPYCSSTSILRQEVFYYSWKWYYCYEQAGVYDNMHAPMMIGLCAVAVLVAVTAIIAEFPPGTYLLPLALCVAFNLAVMLVTHGVIAQAGERRRRA